MLQTRKLISKKRKNSSLAKKKSFIGSATGVDFINHCKVKMRYYTDVGTISFTKKTFLVHKTRAAMTNIIFSFVTIMVNGLDNAELEVMPNFDSLCSMTGMAKVRPANLFDTCESFNSL